MMHVHVVDPLADDRWDDLVARHPKASAFHKKGWLKALRLTYGYEPFVVTSAASAEQMNDGMVFCRVNSWATGTRAVSLPFADHCEPLVNESDKFFDFLEWLQEQRLRQEWKYLEFRPLLPFWPLEATSQSSSSYCCHELDITPSLEHIFRQMHRDCIRRKVRRAERERLSYEVGRTPELMEEFYQLLLISRRRLGIPPQPQNWFRNLLECLENDLDIRLVRKEGIPIASMLTLNHQRSVIYKYGCSNPSFHNCGGVPFLFWKLIEESKAWGAQKIDFGRTDLRNDGLIRFKDRFGARKHTLNYYRCPSDAKGPAENCVSRILSQVISVLPDSIPEVFGRILYRHVG
jgi:CelD/BcsL family acetyltransferase involved in cellulose biosynthesis